MKITIESYTPNALDLLLKTKGTRLSHNEDPTKWSDKTKKEHLEYMRDTIKSSWEFVDYTFLIEGVTRAFTHQFVRTRTGSYAQETMRAIDVRDHAVNEPESISADGEFDSYWHSGINSALNYYSRLIDAGAPIQDARGILPTNITTSIWAKFNLRTLHDMAKLRLFTRTAGEYQNVFRLMREAVLEVHPWAEDFIQVHCVESGTCAFPRYGKTECPIYDIEMDNTLLKEKTKKKFWSIRYEANPVSKEGMTQ